MAKAINNYNNSKISINAEQELCGEDTLAEAERYQLLVEWNKTQSNYPIDKCIHQLFEEQVERSPNAVAVVFEGEQLTYRELNAKANQLAHYLQSLGVKPEVLVGICVERSIDMIVAVLGVSKAGGVYVPLDPKWPKERIRKILDSQKVRYIIAQYSLLRTFQELQWLQPQLTDVICLDINTPLIPSEEVKVEEVRLLWDNVAAMAKNPITAGGFISSYTGQAFSNAEVDEYINHITKLAQPYLGKDKRVLEIGCGSGLIMFSIALQVQLYVGIDPSQLTQNRNQETLERKEHTNIRLLTEFAHEIESIEDAPFDLIIIASTIQFFPGYIYLEEVIQKAWKLLAPDGAILLADVMDLRRKDEFKETLEEFKSLFTQRSDLKVKTNRECELYVDKDFLCQLAENLNPLANISIFKREEGFANELGYRYDAVLKKDAYTNQAQDVIPVNPKKNIWTQWHVCQCANSNLLTSVTSDNTAYIIYTSGSTGIPKGVIVRHKPVINLIDWVNKTFQVSSSDRLLFITSLCFDLSVYDIFGILAAGGSIHIASECNLRNPEQLANILYTEPITFWDSAPAFLQQLVPFFSSKNPTSSQVRLLFLSGDWIPVTLPDILKKAFPGTQVIGLGGATEATIWSNYYPIEKVDSNWVSIPYGKPIQNVKYYILDANLNLCPIGAAGVLYIGGECLASGYDDPIKTVEKFIPDPFSNCPEARLYNTGDRARYLPDSNIEFLGRIDNQVKIRGFRIELGEIEALLRQHPDVREAVVIVREDTYSDKRLVAYVVGQLQNSSNRPLQKKISQKLIPHIRSFLREKLPEYMVPSTFVLLDALPLTPNGKVDRQALPAPDNARADLEENFVAPGTYIEKVLAGIWSKVLGLEKVGIHDNFLELGAHSLLAIQIISRLRDTLNVELPLDSLFASPTVAELAKLIEAGDWEKPFKQAPPIQPISRNQNLPLSWSQEHLWFLAQLEPDAPVYNEPFTIRFESAINVDALLKALKEIIKRHESLRTNFITVDGQPVQAIALPSTFNLTVVDLRKLPQKERETEALRLATIDAKKRFDLTDGLLLRATLMQLVDEDYRLFLTCHHIVIDGFSVYRVFLKELETLYEAFSTGQPLSLTPLPIQYVDFALWQRRWVTQEILSSQLNYWKQQLADLPVLYLPYDRPRSARQTFRGARLCLALSKDLTLGLKALSQQSRVTLYTTLLAAFKTLLYRYTGQSDIVVGTVSAGRNQPQIEELIGYFLNTLVLRTDMSGCPSFLELLSRVQEVTLGAYAREDLPFLQLVQTLQSERNLGQNPLFQVAFVLEPPMPSLKSGWTVSQLDIQTDMAKFDLTLELDDRPEGVIGRFEYNTDLFEASTISRVAGHFQTLLSAIVANPQQLISELPLLTKCEQHQLLVEWNNTQTEYPQDKCIHELFEEQVKRSPTSVAVVFEGKQLTYQELNAKANQVAYYLQSLGVKPEVLVGICVERSLEMVVGLLGILKAGGAYVPLDPAYPGERLAFMLQDTSVPVLLTGTEQIDKLPQLSAQIVCLDRDWPEIAFLSKENLVSEVTPDNLAYVMYTSGSTGQPKGVEVVHRGINRLLFGVNYVHLDATQIFLQLAPISFDASTFEIWGALLHGAKCVLFPGTIPTSQNLSDEIRKHGITILWLTAALFNSIIDNDEKALSGIKQLLIGGEALSVAHVQKALKALPETQIINGYGPTESTTFSCCYPIPRQLETNIGSIPIGRPIANTQIYILNSHLQPVPIGVPGEFYIGGAGLAQGYLNRSELTKEKFIRNPFSSQPGDRLYKTGDLARYLSDGNIEFIGRVDDQVKIRGFRIELGEIEALLRQHPDVREAVVTVREDIPDDKRLVVYVVSNFIPERLSHISSCQLELDGNSLQRMITANLRDYLKQKLPDYMVPSGFVLMKALPLTPNGKVDRRALMAPDNWGIELEDNFVAPKTPTEEILAAIWAEVLGLEQVGVNDSFFELGGHSLLATQIISRIRSAFSIELPIRSLFEAPTIASLARVIETAEKEKLQEQSEGSTKLDTLPPLLPLVQDTEIPLSFSQQSLWELQQLHIYNCAYNSPIALCFNGLLREEVLEKSINEIICRHQILRTTFAVIKEQPVQVIAPSLTLPLNVIDLQHLPEQEREVEAVRLANQEALHYFDLASGPLIKTTLLCFAPQKHWLLIIMHHIITDGWSYSILLQELETLYEAFSKGLLSPLPGVTIQYADFTLWQQKYLTEETLEKQRSYWLQKLANIAPRLDLLPTFPPKPNSNNKRVESYSIVLPYNQVDSIAALSHSQEVTIFVIILAALKILLYKLSGQTDTIILATTANRSTLEVEKMLGCFINDVFLRDKIDSLQAGFTFLKQVNQTIGEALANQDIPEKSIKTISKLEFIRTINISMAPPVRWHSRILESEVASICLEHELWDEQSFPLELYIYFHGEDYTTIEIVGYYSTNCFTKKSIERLFSDYQEILKQLVQYPETVLSEFELAPFN